MDDYQWLFNLSRVIIVHVEYPKRTENFFKISLLILHNGGIIPVKGLNNFRLAKKTWRNTKQDGRLEPAYFSPNYKYFDHFLCKRLKTKLLF